MARFKLGYFTTTKDEDGAVITGYWADKHLNKYRFAQRVSKEVRRPVNPGLVEHLWGRTVDMHPEGEEVELVEPGAADGRPITVIRSD